MQFHDSNTKQGTVGDSEITLLDVLCFLKVAYKPILFSGIAGLAIAIVDLAVTPKQYEAIAQIAMAQISTTNHNSNINSGLNLLSINVEEPSLLIARFSQPNSFTPQVIEACKVVSSIDPGAILAKSIKLALPKGVPNVVELKTYSTSPKDAHSCAWAIFEQIKTSQAELVAPYLNQAKMSLDERQARLQDAKDFVVKATKSGQSTDSAYFYARDEIRFLLDEISALKNIVVNDQSRVTRLILPVYASETPIAPKKRVVLGVGLIGGLFLGFLIVLARQMIAKLKNDLQRRG